MTRRRSHVNVRPLYGFWRNLLAFVSFCTQLNKLHNLHDLHVYKYLSISSHLIKYIEKNFNHMVRTIRVLKFFLQLNMEICTCFPIRASTVTMVRYSESKVLFTDTYFFFFVKLLILQRVDTLVVSGTNLCSTQNYFTLGLSSL